VSARRRLALAAALSVALAAAACVFPGRAADAPVVENPKTGERAALAPGARALHLVFFATWCPPCVEELPRLAELEARWGDEGYRLVLVAVQTRQTSARLASFLAEHEVPGETWFAVSGEAEKFWKSDHLPSHIVLDAKGQEVARAGSLTPQVTAAIEQLLGTRGPRPGTPR